MLRSKDIFVAPGFTLGMGIFNYLIRLCGYQIGYGLGVKLQQALISSGKLGIVFINVYWLNVLISGFTIIFSVFTSLIGNAGIGYAMG